MLFWPYRVRLLAVFTLLTVLSFSIAAHSLMPPHVERSVPSAGLALSTPALTLYGYSLDESTLKGLKVTELWRGSRALPFTKTIVCTAVGKGDCAGCKQLRCKVSLGLAWIRKGASYRVQALNWHGVFKANASVGEVERGDKSKSKAVKPRSPKRRP
ncbi:MAG: hypothetical protein CMH53_08560 [Myxococcales bacterium]|nr:hypothetical protein [Myxococcales bacterium]